MLFVFVYSHASQGHDLMIIKSLIMPPPHARNRNSNRRLILLALQIQEFQAQGEKKDACGQDQEFPFVNIDIAAKNIFKKFHKQYNNNKLGDNILELGNARNTVATLSSHTPLLVTDVYL